MGIKQVEQAYTKQVKDIYQCLIIQHMQVLIE